MKVLIPTLALVLLTGCGALVPLDHHPTNGPNQILVINNLQNTIRLGFMFHQAEHLVFDLEISNNGYDTLYFSPGDLRCFVSNKPFRRESEQPTDPSQVINTIPSRRPEQVLQMMQRRERSKAAWGAAFVVLGTALLVADISQDTKDAKKPAWTERDAQKAVNRDILVASSFTVADVLIRSQETDRMEQHYLEHELFPAGFIAPGTRVRGKVFFPREHWGSYFRILLPIDSTHNVFDFKLERLSKQQSGVQK